MLGAVAKATGVDASLLARDFDGWIDRLYPLAQAILEKRTSLE